MACDTSAMAKAIWLSSSNNEKDGGPQILECHSPLLNVLEQHSIVGRFEQDMFEAVLGTRVRREVSRNSGLYECAFYFSA